MRMRAKLAGTAHRQTCRRKQKASRRAVGSPCGQGVG
jgi:hypothetical protein